jgi:hypothetical protein
MSAEGTRTAGGASDSPRYCATCDDYGEHHTDRHPAGAERQQEQARTFTVWACRNCGIEEHQWTGTVRATPRCKPGFTHVFETVEVVERAPFEERVRREERDRIVATLRRRFRVGSSMADIRACHLAIEIIESLPVSPGPEEGER